MSDRSSSLAGFPPEQEAIRAECFHPSGTFVPFESEEIEQSIPERFEKIIARRPDRIAVKVEDRSITYDALKLPVQSLFGAPTVAEMGMIITRNQAKKVGQEKLTHMLSELESLSDEDAQPRLTDEIAGGSSKNGND